jgi:hypothetical protein
MSILGSNMLAGAAGRARHEIERSLRFNANDSAHLTRTPSSASNSTTFTWSAWVKTNRTDSHETLFSATPSGDGTLQYDFILENNQLYIYGIETFFVYEKKLSRVFRDRSAWYHLVVAFDTTDSTAEDRIKIYVNGERQTDFATNSNPSASRTTGFNKTNEHSIGARTGYSGAQYFDGYQAEINFIDGSQLGPESFGQTDLETGAWIPRQYNGSYGTNGFYLKFADNSGVTATTLGKDSSGNGNNWTPNNFSVTTGADNDSVLDTPTNNWCTLNSLLGDSLNITSNGSLRVGGTQNNYAVGTIPFPSSGKYYAEATLTTYSSGQVQFGICPADAQSNLGNDATAILQDGSTTVNQASSTSLASYTQGDVIGIAVDVDNSTVQFYKNNTAQTALTNVLRITEASFFTYLSISSTVINYNFGQQGFKYTPPAGFRALNAKNLPTPTVHDGTKYFNTVLYTGNFSTQSITGVGFKPDFVWIKGRGSATYNNHILTDVVRGAGNLVQTNVTVAEAAAAASLTSFDSDGFSLGAFEDVNTNSNTYVAWNWKAGGTASNNSDGSINGLVSANPEAGFSIVAYTGTGSETTVGHGLGVTPGMIWVKNRDANEGWIIDSRLVTGNTNGTLHFNTDAEYTGGTNQFGTHSSSIFTVKTSGNINTSGQKYVAYVFAEVEGYSKFGTFTGNGSSGANGNGPYVHCGFRPAFIIMKVDNSAYNWYVYDSTRNTYNAGTYLVFPNLSDSESQSTDHFDWLSNGFKVRGDTLSPNGTTVFFMAFAERPFKYANAV